MLLYFTVSFRQYRLSPSTHFNLGETAKRAIAPDLFPYRACVGHFVLDLCLTLESGAFRSAMQACYLNPVYIFMEREVSW